MNTTPPAARPRLSLRFEHLPAGEPAFVVAAMFTPSHAALAKRLADSLRRFGVTHAMYEVPAVHDSIAANGNLDPVHTKANFIWHVLREVGRPVLYLDADTVIRRVPELIGRLVGEGCDFAILNWLALDDNDAYMPVPCGPEFAREVGERRFFQFSRSIDRVAHDQLICSGAVQVWGTTPAAASLLRAWHDAVVAYTHVADDQCLDFVFNHRLGDRSANLRPHWLPKAYARIAWWIFDEPVIDHPQMPRLGHLLRSIEQAAARPHVLIERTTPRTAKPAVPRDLIIDTETGTLLRVENAHFVVAGNVMRKTYLDR